MIRFQRGQTLPIAAVVAGVVAILFLIVFWVSSTANIEAGHEGVVTHWGQTDPTPLDPGSHHVTPFQDSVTVINVQAQKHPFAEAAASTKENQNVYFDGGVVYNIDKHNVVKLFNSVGVDFAGKIFDPAFQDYIKEVTPQYSALDMQNHRADIRDAVLLRMKDQGNRYGIDVTDVFITNFHFDKSFEEAIKARAVSQQQLAQAEIDAQTAVAKAEGDAKSNQIRSSSLNDQILRQQDLANQAAMIAKWDGHQSQIQGGTPLIQLPSSK